MLRTLESRIRLKAILIYLIVAIICGGAIIYLYQLRQSVDDYKNNIEEYNTVIAHTDSLIQFINETQQEANQYVLTRRLAHLRQFRQNQQTIEFLLDSLQQDEKYPYLNDLFHDIHTLLKEKGSVISRLNRQFIIQDTPDPISERLSRYEPVVQTDSVLITTVVQDTTIHVTPTQRRNFWQRIFSNEKEPDTLVTVSTTQTDTLLIVNQADSLSLLSEITNYTEQIHQDYRDRLNAIQKEVNRLLIADQEISTHMSGLLLDLYSNSILHILEDIELQEDEIRRINTLSLILGIVALFFGLVFIILIFQDVNKGLRNRKALEEANLQIQDTMESRHRLLLSMSHDIKTPLNSILGHPELTEKTNASLPAKDITSIQSAGAYILALLNNVLEFSALEQGALTPSLLPFNLKEFCEEVEGICIPLARQKGLSFITHYHFDFQLHVKSDPLKLKQILLNLLSNAIKYTEKGDVELIADYREDALIFQLSDTGTGMEEDKIKDLFKPFVRMESNRNRAEGTGIGLYVVKGLTELLQGTIEVNSIPGRGTQIMLTIPAKTVEIPVYTTAKRILLLDDNFSLLTLLADMLTHLGHEPEICHSLTGLVEKMNNPVSYDMVFTDMEMGDVTGTDVLYRIRQQWKDIPVVIMTGRGDFSYQKAIELGFTNYLPKPISSGLLKSLLGGQAVENQQAGFESLEELFGNDKEIIQEILETFISSTFTHMCNLEEALVADDFDKAQRICHTMLPMCMQINATETIEILKEMDSRRDKLPEDYPQWKEEIEELIQQTGKVIERIYQNYPELCSSID